MNNRIISIVFVLLAAFAQTAKAQLFLEEGKVSLAVAGGDRINKSLVIANTSSEAVNVRIYWEDFEYKPPYEGTKTFMPAGTSVLSASRWVSFTPQTISLPAFGKQKIDYTISVPGVMDKGYYGVLFFEQTGTNLKDASGLNIITRVGCLFFIDPKDKLKRAVVDQLKINANEIVGNFTNQGNVIMIPRMVYYIMDEGGLVKDRGELKKLYVPPGQNAAWTLPLPTTLGQGKYSLVLNSDLGDEDVLVKEIEVVKDLSGQLSIENVKD